MNTSNLKILMVNTYKKCKNLSELIIVKIRSKTQVIDKNLNLCQLHEE